MVLCTDQTSRDGKWQGHSNGTLALISGYLLHTHDIIWTYIMHTNRMYELCIMWYCTCKYVLKPIYISVCLFVCLSVYESMYPSLHLLHMDLDICTFLLLSASSLSSHAWDHHGRRFCSAPPWSSCWVALVPAKAHSAPALPQGHPGAPRGTQGHPGAPRGTPGVPQG